MQKGVIYIYLLDGLEFLGFNQELYRVSNERQTVVGYDRNLWPLEFATCSRLDTDEQIIHFVLDGRTTYLSKLLWSLIKQWRPTPIDLGSGMLEVLPEKPPAGGIITAATAPTKIKKKGKKNE
ncbi:MAG: hypothetical protein WC477_07420 [Patescibacteria group bacterium]